MLGVASTDPLALLAALRGVDEVVMETRRALDRLGAHRVLRRHGGAVRTESVLRGAAAAASIELGREVDVDELRAAADDGNAADPVARGAMRAYLELGGLVAVWRQAPRQALARLHMLAGRDLVQSAELGHPRTGDPGDRLAQLLDLVAVSRAPALVVAAVVHGELATVRPFGSVDRVVALAASRLVLAERGLDPGGYAVLEIGHQDREVDAAALRAYASGTGDGVATWVLHCGQALLVGATEALAIAESIRRG